MKRLVSTVVLVVVYPIMLCAAAFWLLRASWRGLREVWRT